MQAYRPSGLKALGRAGSAAEEVERLWGVQAQRLKGLEADRLGDLEA